MRRFYAQQIAVTCLIAGVWLLTLVLLTRTAATAVVEAPQTVDPSGLMSQRLEPRDESTGEEVRLHKFNDLGSRTEVEVKFKDKWKATIYFNALGRRSRAVEFAPDGERIEYQFGRDGKSLKRISTYRANGVLKTDTVPVDQTTERTTRYADDGKTKVSVQTTGSNGAWDLAVYHGDGKTVRHILKRTGTTTQELVTYNEKGVITDIDRIFLTRQGGGFMHPGFVVRTVEHTRFREDGKTPAYRQQYASVLGRKDFIQLEEFLPDGKTVSSRLTRVQSAFRIANQEPGYQLQLFGAKGELTTTKMLRADMSVAGTEDTATKQRTEYPDRNTKELRYAELIGGSPARDLDKLPRAEAGIGTNHLPQLLAD